MESLALTCLGGDTGITRSLAVAAQAWHPTLLKIGKWIIGNSFRIVAQNARLSARLGNRYNSAV